MLRPRRLLLIFTGFAISALGLVPLAPPMLGRARVSGSTTVTPVVVKCLEQGGSA